MVACADFGFGWRVENHLAGDLSNGQDDDAEFGAELGLAKRFRDVLGAFSDLHLFDADVEAHVVTGGEIDELVDVWLEERLGEALTGDGVGGENDVCAGAAEFAFGLLFTDACGDGKNWIEGFGGEDEVGVVGVGGEGGDEAASAVNTGIAEDFIARGIGGDGKQAGMEGALDTLLISVDDEDGHAGFF